MLVFVSRTIIHYHPVVAIYRRRIHLRVWSTYLSLSFWIIRPVGVPTCQAGLSLALSTPPHWQRLFNTNSLSLHFTLLCCSSPVALKCSPTLVPLQHSHMTKSHPLEVRITAMWGQELDGNIMEGHFVCMMLSCFLAVSWTRAQLCMDPLHHIQKQLCVWF